MLIHNSYDSQQSIRLSHSIPQNGASQKQMVVKKVPIGESTPVKLWLFLISEISHTGVQKTYKTAHFPQTARRRKNGKHMKFL
jgi:hypothetical protein